MVFVSQSEKWSWDYEQCKESKDQVQKGRKSFAQLARLLSDRGDIHQPANIAYEFVAIAHANQ